MNNLRLAILALALLVLIALGWRVAHRESEPPIIVTVDEPIVTVTEPPPAPVEPPAVVAPPVVEPPAAAKPFRRKPPTDSTVPPLRRPTDTTPSRVARKSPEADPPGWSLPYSCSRVRWYSLHFSETALEAMRIAAHLPKPSDDQLRQIKVCLAQK